MVLIGPQDPAAGGFGVSWACIRRKGWIGAIRCKALVNKKVAEAR